MAIVMKKTIETDGMERASKLCDNPVCRIYLDCFCHSLIFTHPGDLRVRLFFLITTEIRMQRSEKRGPTEGSSIW